MVNWSLVRQVRAGLGVENKSMAGYAFKLKNMYSSARMHSYQAMHSSTAMHIYFPGLKYRLPKFPQKFSASP